MTKEYCYDIVQLSSSVMAVSCIVDLSVGEENPLWKVNITLFNIREEAEPKFFLFDVLTDVLSMPENVKLVKYEVWRPLGYF